MHTNKFKTRNAVNNFRKSSRRGKNDVALTRDFLFSGKNQNFVIYPPSNSVFNPKDFLIILSSPELIETAVKYGQNLVGIDGIWKWMRYRLPVWIMIVIDEFIEAIPVFIGIGATEDTNHLSLFLREVKKTIEKHTHSEWAPFVMIDHSEPELAACMEHGLQPLMCDFHATKAISRNLPPLDSAVEQLIWAGIKNVQRSVHASQASKHIKEFNSLCLRMQVPETFITYMEKNWWTPRWLNTYIDQYRKTRNGLENTNNFTEAILKSIGKTYLDGRNSLGVAEFINRIVDVVFPNEIIKISHKKAGRIQKKKSKQDYTDEEISNKAKKIIENQLIFSVYPDSGIWKCQNKEKIPNYVNLDTKSCTCQFHKWYGKMCKHLVAASQIDKPPSFEDNTPQSIPSEEEENVHEEDDSNNPPDGIFLPEITISITSEEESSGEVDHREVEEGEENKGSSSEKFKHHKKRGKKKVNKKPQLPENPQLFGEIVAHRIPAPLPARKYSFLKKKKLINNQKKKKGEVSQPKSFQERKRGNETEIEREWRYVKSELNRVQEQLKKNSFEGKSYMEAPHFWLRLAEHVGLELPEEMVSNYVEPEHMHAYFWNNVPFDLRPTNTNNNQEEKPSEKKKKSTSKTIATSNTSRKRSRICCVCSTVVKSDYTQGQDCEFNRNGPLKKQCACAAAGVTCGEFCECDC